MRLTTIIALTALTLLLAATLVFALRPALLTSTLIALGLAPAPPPRSNELTIEERLALIDPAATLRIKPYFDAAKVPYPPAAVTLVGLKADKLLQLYARGPAPDDAWRLIHTYPVRAASGHLGPKLKEGDRQVPEGVYGVDYLNPNSKFSVSMRVTYPNDFDRAMAAKDKRDKDTLGNAIMIHGRASSIGCLAMGDPASEELFVLAHAVGLENMTVILAPVDFRKAPRPTLDQPPVWIDDLYTQIDEALKPLPLPSGTAS